MVGSIDSRPTDPADHYVHHSFSFQLCGSNTPSSTIVDGSAKGIADTCPMRKNEDKKGV